MSRLLHLLLLKFPLFITFLSLRKAGTFAHVSLTHSRGVPDKAQVTSRRQVRRGKGAEDFPFTQIRDEIIRSGNIYRGKRDTYRHISYSYYGRITNISPSPSPPSFPLSLQLSCLTFERYRHAINSVGINCRRWANRFAPQVIVVAAI